MSCKACQHPDRENLERQVWLGQLSTAEAAKIVDMSYDDYWKHLKEHRLSFKKEEVDAGDLQTTLRYLVRGLKQRYDQISALPPNLGNEKAIATLGRLLKDVVMDVAKLEHLISESPIVQIQNVMMQQDEIVTFLTSELCPICRQKTLEYLKPRATEGVEVAVE